MCGRKNYRLQDIQLIKITALRADALRACVLARGAPTPHSARTPYCQDPKSRLHVAFATSRAAKNKLFKDRRTLRAHRPAAVIQTFLAEWGFQGPHEAATAQCGRCNQSGEYRARTGDLLVANQALSQLS